MEKKHRVRKGCKDMKGTDTKAVILAAGVGTRLGEITKDIPKCLLELNSKSIIESQIDELAAADIDNIIVVIGYQSEMVRERLGNKVTYIENNSFSETNSSYSLWLARDYIRDGWMHMNCDLLFSPTILENVLLPANQNSIAVDLDIKPEDDQEKVTIENGIIRKMSKTMPFQEAQGKTIGMARFSKEGASAVLNYLETVVHSGEKNRWFFSIIADVLHEVEFRAVPTDGNFWAEIDTPEDLVNARKLLMK